MEPFIAEIIMFGGNFAPRGWAFCNGQLLAISQNQALFSLLGTTYGGDGRTTFGLPDLRGRAPIHAGTGPGLPAYRLGERGGNPSATLPAHTHTATATVSEEPVYTAQLKAYSEGGNLADPAGARLANTGAFDKEYYKSGTSVDMESDAIVLAKTGSTKITVENSNAGTLGASNMQPFLAINYIIALQGTFPSRS